MEINKPITIITFLIIIVIVTFLFVVPKYQEYHDGQTKILEAEAQYSGQSIYYARISEVLAGLEGRKDVLNTIQSALPVGFSLGPVVSFLQKKSSENGVRITSIVFSQASPLLLTETSGANDAGQIKDVAFTLTLAGNYQGLKNFLLAMDNSARLFEMDTVSFSAVDSTALAKNKAQEYVLKLEVKTHSY